VDSRKTGNRKLKEDAKGYQAVFTLRRLEGQPPLIIYILLSILHSSILNDIFGIRLFHAILPLTSWPNSIALSLSSVKVKDGLRLPSAEIFPPSTVTVVDFRDY